MKKLILLLAIAISPLFVSAQNSETEKPFIKHHSIYTELGGSSLFYSLNYDYTFYVTETKRWTVGTGAALFSITPAHSRGEETSKYAFVPLITPHLNLLHGKGSHYLETGAFLNFTLGFSPGLRIGYRYQRSHGGFLFRAGLTPMFLSTIPIVLPGLSFGYTF